MVRSPPPRLKPPIRSAISHHSRPAPRARLEIDRDSRENHTGSAQFNAHVLDRHAMMRQHLRRGDRAKSPTPKRADDVTYDSSRQSACAPILGVVGTPRSSAAHRVPFLDGCHTVFDAGVHRAVAREAERRCARSRPGCRRPTSKIGHRDPADTAGYATPPSDSGKFRIPWRPTTMPCLKGEPPGGMRRPPKITSRQLVRRLTLPTTAALADRPSAWPRHRGDRHGNNIICTQ